MSERAYWVQVDGASYKLHPDSLPQFDAIRRIHSIIVFRANGDECPAYARLRNGPYTFTLPR